MAFSLKARVVFPVDRPPIENGIVTIEDGIIVDVGTRPAGADVRDLGSSALLPGLINTHTHLEFSDLRQPLGTPGMPFVDWIRAVIAKRARSSHIENTGLVRGLLESRASGVTTVGEVATQAEPLAGDIIDVTYFHEVIGFSRARAESALAAAMSRVELGERWLDFRVAGSLKTGLGSCDIRHGISPHAPYTVSPQLVYELVLNARQKEMPVMMHLAESPEELELLASGTGPFRQLLEERSMWDPNAIAAGYGLAQFQPRSPRARELDAIPGGSRPLNYLQLLADAPRSLVIHGNYLEEDELAFMAERRDRMTLVYCPRTHAYFDHGAYPLSQALRAGVRVALGTDSRASNPDLNLLEEMRFVARQYVGISRHDILRMGTLAGAEALGRAEKVGSLTVGKCANIIAVPVEAGNGTECEALLESLLASREPASHVWFRGSRIKRRSADLL